MNWLYKFLAAQQAPDGHCTAVVHSPTEVVWVHARRPGRKGEVDVHGVLRDALQISREFQLDMDVAVGHANSVAGNNCRVQSIFPLLRSHSGLAARVREALQL